MIYKNGAILIDASLICLIFYFLEDDHGYSYFAIIKIYIGLFMVVFVYQMFISDETEDREGYEDDIYDST